MRTTFFHSRSAARRAAASRNASFLPDHTPHNTCGETFSPARTASSERALMPRPSAHHLATTASAKPIKVLSCCHCSSLSVTCACMRGDGRRLECGQRAREMRRVCRERHVARQERMQPLCSVARHFFVVLDLLHDNRLSPGGGRYNQIANLFASTPFLEHTYGLD